MAKGKDKPKKNVDDELDEMFAGVGDEETTTTASTTGNAKPTPTSSTGEADIDDQTAASNAQDDPLADLANIASAPRLSTGSRPATPAALAAAQAAKKKQQQQQQSAGSGSEDKDASSAQTATSSTSQTPTAATPAAPASAAGAGGWWGGLTALASSARKQAEAAVKELQNNEEAQKWAEQMKGNYGALRGFGDDLRSKALPTFTNILHTLAPPISQHERLQIHITHDIVGFPDLDPLIYQTFSRVMAQVEGGDLLVIQRGSESAPRQGSSSSESNDRSGAGVGQEKTYAGSLISKTGWSDGPWWRHDARRSLGAVPGLVEGTKLARASAESYSRDFFAGRGGIEEAAKQATTALSESNPVRSSDIFVAIQAVQHSAPGELFGASAAGAPDSDSGNKSGGIVVDSAAAPDQLVSFAVFLHDPIHAIEIASVSQPVPQRWADWIEAAAAGAGEGAGAGAMPEAIREVVETGGVDPREWVAEWLEEVLSLSVGVVAQRYVARRMGVGEGGIGRGKRREEAVENFAGEAARVI